jgi:hypothetical protein
VIALRERTRLDAALFEAGPGRELVARTGNHANRAEAVVRIIEAHRDGEYDRAANPDAVKNRKK